MTNGGQPGGVQLLVLGDARLNPLVERIATAAAAASPGSLPCRPARRSAGHRDIARSGHRQARRSSRRSSQRRERRRVDDVLVTAANEHHRSGRRNPVEVVAQGQPLLAQLRLVPVAVRDDDPAGLRGLRTRAATAASTSPSDRARDRSTPGPPPAPCRWLSINPGMTVRPARSICRASRAGQSRASGWSFPPRRSDRRSPPRLRRWCPAGRRCAPDRRGAPAWLGPAAEQPPVGATPRRQPRPPRAPARGSASRHAARRDAPSQGPQPPCIDPPGLPGGSSPHGDRPPMPMTRTLALLPVMLLAACGGETTSSSTSPPASSAPAAAADVGALAVEDRVAGTGAEARPGMMVSVHYTGWLYAPAAADKRARSSTARRTATSPFEFQLGAGDVITGWDEGVVRA